MTAVVGAMLLCVAMFGLIGIGPALALLRGRDRLETALAAGPALGFALVSLVVTYLVKLDIPVHQRARLVVAIGIAVSSTLVLWRLRAARKTPDALNRGSLACLLAGLVLTCAIVAVPLMVGGFKYTVLRGNPWDSNNYAMVARLLDRDQLSWAKAASSQELFDRDNVYGSPIAGLIPTRWTTSAMLAWSADAAGVSILDFEFAFSMLGVILMLGPVYVLCRCGGLRPVLALGLALAACVGFGGTFPVDVRAQSQVNGVMTLLLLAMLLARAARKDQAVEGQTPLDTGKAPVPRIPWPEVALIGIPRAAIILLYVEMLPMTLLAEGLFVLYRILREKAYRWALSYAASLAVTLVLILPVWQFLADFLISQLHFAAAGQKVTWELTYFPWLYANMPRAHEPMAGGLWGISWMQFPAFLGEGVSPVLELVGMLLCGLGIAAFVWAILRKEFSPAGRLSAFLALAALAQFLFLYSRDQFWAAGKAWSFGHPYTILLCVFFAVSLAHYRRPAEASPEKSKQSDQVPAWRKPAVILAVALVGLWATSQLGFGLGRIGRAKSDIIPDGYIVSSHLPEYRRMDSDPQPFRQALANLGQEKRSIGIVTGSTWTSEYWTHALADDATTHNDDLLREAITPEEGLARIAKQSRSRALELQSLGRDKAMVIMRNERMVNALIQPQEIVPDAAGNLTVDYPRTYADLLGKALEQGNDYLLVSKMLVLVLSSDERLAKHAAIVKVRALMSEQENIAPHNSELVLLKLH